MPVSDMKSIIQGVSLLQIYTDGGVSFLLQMIESENRGGGRIILKATGAVSRFNSTLSCHSEMLNYTKGSRKLQKFALNYLSKQNTPRYLFVSFTLSKH